MLINKYKNIKISSIACTVPEKYISIESLKNGENNTALDKFVKTTSVQGHYETDSKQTAADLVYIAAKRIVEDRNIDKNAVGVLVFITQYPDYKSPSTACVLQYRLGLSMDCLAFDVNLGCSGYVYGLNIVSSLMQTSNAQYGLLLAGDTPTKGVRKDNSMILFGDAGSATLLSKNNDSIIEMNFSCCTDGGGFKTLLRPYGHAKHPDKLDTEGVFDELGVFNFAIEKAPQLINDFLKIIKQSPDNFDCIALHQANMMIMKQIIKKTHFSKEQMIVSLDEFANTSSVSIPLAFVKKYGNHGRDQILKSLICGYGVGLSWGVGNIFVNIKDIYPIIKTSEYFDDGLYN